ncbi:hypothetical protein HK098_000413 [Nowakowskiella sp. JEL0407]|nr:hypothetical protein HK098_000413 [Nowakowskiella sp. JEL0407]
MKLTPAILSSLIPPNTKLPDAVEINCAGKDISHIEDISVAVNLHKLNLSQNNLKTAESLAGFQYNAELTWLNLSNNQLESLEGFEKLKKLLVLNLSHNRVNRISHHISSCTELKALILNNNEIRKMENLSTLKKLTTLVISHNQIDEVTGIAALTSLNKLSAAHNRIRIFPTLSTNIELAELKLNDNKLTNIPEDKLLPLSSCLKILDLGNNLIRSFADIVALASLRNLVNLNLKGNPVCTQEGYRERILALVPTLRVLDGERFDEKFLQRKQKRKAMEKKVEKKIKKEKVRNDSGNEESDGNIEERKSEAKKRKSTDVAESSALSQVQMKRRKNDGASSKSVIEKKSTSKMAKPVADQTKKTNNSLQDEFFLAYEEPELIPQKNTLSTSTTAKVNGVKTRETTQSDNHSAKKPPTKTALTANEVRSGVVAVIDVSKKKAKVVESFNPDALSVANVNERLGLQTDIEGWD